MVLKLWCLSFVLLWINVGAQFVKRFEKRQILTFNLRIAFALDDRGWSKWMLAAPVLCAWLVEAALWPFVGLWLRHFGTTTTRTFFFMMPPQKGKQYIN